MSLSLQYSLSEELLDRIISLTPQPTLASLCRVSQKINRIATPHLYANVYLDADFGSETGLAHILPFTYLIFTSALHASLVRSFAIRDTWGEDAPVWEDKNEKEGGEGGGKGSGRSEYDKKRPWPHSGTQELENVLRERSTAFAADEQEAAALYAKMRSGANEDAILAVLLASLPNLRKLDLSTGFCVDREELIGMLERVGKRRRPFDKLPPGPIASPVDDAFKLADPTPFSSPIEVLITGNEDKYPNSPIHFGALLNLPNLRSIYGWKMGESEQEEATRTFAQLKPRSCPVEYVECRTSKFHPSDLTLLMNAAIPGRLKTFSYEIGCTWAWVNVKHGEIIKSLEPHYDTLECLALSHEQFYPYQFDDEYEEPYPVSFHCFKALKKLKVAPVYIWGHDGFVEEENLKKPDTKEMLWKALPETLEELWVTRAEGQEEPSQKESASPHFVPDCLIPALERVVQHQPETYPRLRHLRIEFPLAEWKDDWLDLLVSFCRNAEANEICCTLILAELGYMHWEKTPERGWGWDEDVEWNECCTNQENSKFWIKVAETQDLGGRLRELKDWDKEEKRKNETEEQKSIRERQERGGNEEIETGTDDDSEEDQEMEDEELGPETEGDVESSNED